MVPTILLEATVPVVAGLGLVAVVVRGVSSPRLCRLAAGARGPWRRRLGVFALVGVAAVGAAVAKLFALPLGRAGILLAGVAGFGYVHLEVFAAAHGFRKLGVPGPDRAATLSRLTYWFAAWLVYTTERHPWLPVVCLGLGVVAAPAAFVALSPVVEGAEAALAVGGALVTEALVLAVGTGYRRAHLFPEEPRERVRDALGTEG